MIKDSKKFEEEDKAIKAKIDARNSMENYIYHMKNTIEDKDKLSDKISEEDKSSISDAIKDSQEWLETNGDQSEAVDIEDKLKDL